MVLIVLKKPTQILGAGGHGQYKKVEIKYKGETRMVPETYVKGLKGDDLKKQIKSIFEEKDRPKDVKFKSKRSPWCQQFQNKYDTTIQDMDFIDENLLKKEGAEQIIEKGMQAYRSSGSRPKQNPFSWGKARLCSVLMGGKSRKVDQKIYEKYRVLNYKLDKVEEINKNKRYKAFFSDGSTVQFGQTKPKRGTFIDTKDKELKENYIKRHESDLDTLDPTRAGYLSMFLLWNKPTLSASIKDFNKRLKNNDFSLPKV
jgi:hypothetical protein